jgi:hypothetical protein
MSPPEGLVGRDVEFTLAAGAVREAAEGRASALVIEGEAGIGKTRLVECAVYEASTRGVAVYGGQAHPFERTRPFGVVAEALGLSRRSPDPRRAAIGELLGSGGLGEPARAAGDVQYRVIEEIVDLVERTSSQSPMLLVAEDIHWADSASLRTILSVVRQLPLASLVVVVTARSSPQPAQLERLVDDLAAGGAQRLQLQPLSSDELAVLARNLLGAPPGPGLSAMLTKAGGNPLWATATVRSLADEGLLERVGNFIDSTTSELPASVGELVVRRLHDLPPDTLELLRVTAVLGDAVSLRDVAALTRRPPAEVVTRLGPAYDARLLDEVDDRVVFRHQLVQDAIYPQVPPSARRILHREAAMVLMAGGADRLDVADHLILGAERGDEQAVTWLRDAARDASARAPLVTLELVRRAEALLPGGHRDVDLVSAELVQALLRAGKPAEAADRAQAMLARPHSAEVDTGLRVALVAALALQNRAAELVAVVRASLTGSPGLEPSDRVMMLAQQSWAQTYTGDPEAGEASARRGLALAEETSDPAMNVWALTALMVAVGRQGGFTEALTHARRAAALAAESSDTRSLPLQPKFFLGLALFDCDLVDEARAAYRDALDDEFGADCGWLRRSWPTRRLLSPSASGTTPYLV